VTSVNLSATVDMAKKTPQIDSIGNVLDQSLKRFDLTSRLDEYGVWPIWREIVGNMIARNAQPEKIRNGTLFVKVSSPVWMQELQFMKDMIADKLNHRLKGEVVKNIFFMVGRIEETPEDAVAQAPQSDGAEKFAHQIDEEFLQTIEDPEIRAAFQRLVKSYSRRKAKS
jgi:predicted nucleic acid-binding Zn ribbon protein